MLIYIIADTSSTWESTRLVNTAGQHGWSTRLVNVAGQRGWSTWLVNAQVDTAGQHRGRHGWLTSQCGWVPTWWKWTES